MMEYRKAVIVLLGIILACWLAGCARFGGEPRYLEFPDEPHITWALCDPVQDTVRVCISQADAQKLAKWIDKLRAFEHARERLIKK